MPLPSGAVPGIDVSHYQGAVDWETVAGSGQHFGYAKASEGVLGTAAFDLYFADNWAGMLSAGIVRGAYHYFHPHDDPIQQAKHFLDRLAAANGGSAQLGNVDLPPALDIEVTDGVTSANLLAAAQSWLTAVEAATGKRPLVYTYVYFWRTILGNPSDLSNYPLWIAEPSVASPRSVGGWSDWYIWQHASQSLAGVPLKAANLDAFNGSSADLQAFVGQTTYLQSPAPAAT
jgi:lysozyme